MTFISYYVIILNLRVIKRSYGIKYDLILIFYIGIELDFYLRGFFCFLYFYVVWIIIYCF